MNISSIKEIAETIGVLIVGLFIVIKTIKKELAKINKPTEVSKKIKNQTIIDSDIKEKLEMMKEEFKADRICIFEFHNGEHFANGRSAFKCTCTYEVNRAGVNRQQDNLKNIPISIFPRFIKRLFEQKVIKDNDINHLKEYEISLYEFLANMNVKSRCVVTLYNKEEEPLGFICMQYLEQTDVETLIDNNKLLRYAGAVEDKILNCKKRRWLEWI